MAIADQSGGLLAAMWRPLRLETLVTLRWLAVGGQTMGVLFVQFGLGFPLPLAGCLAMLHVDVHRTLDETAQHCHDDARASSVSALDASCDRVTCSRERERDTSASTELS